MTDTLDAGHHLDTARFFDEEGWGYMVICCWHDPCSVYPDRVMFRR